MAKLATDDADRVRRDIEHQIEERLHDAVGDLYRRLGEPVERVSERLQEDENGKPLVIRDVLGRRSCAVACRLAFEGIDIGQILRPSDGSFVLEQCGPTDEGHFEVAHLVGYPAGPRVLES